VRLQEWATGSLPGLLVMLPAVVTETIVTALDLVTGRVIVCVCYEKYFTLVFFCSVLSLALICQLQSARRIPCLGGGSVCICMCVLAVI